MALDDFRPAARHAPASAPANVSPEDEDLFDFPVVEMQLEPAPSAKPAPSAPFASRAPAPRPASTLTEPVRPTDLPQPAVSEPPLDPIALPGFPPASEVEPPATTTPREDVREPARTGFAPRVVWIAATVLCVVNTAGFGALWMSNRSFHAEVDGIRGDLAVAAHDMQVASARDTSPAPAIPATTSEHIESAAPRVPAFEESAVELARREIELGRYSAARTRLYRLLAVADRLDPAVRADVEARASFLIGESYAVALERRLESRR